MLSRIITLQFNTVTGQFDDEVVREFIKDKEVLLIRDHFFIKNETPYLTLVISYNMPQQPMATVVADKYGKVQKRDESWREILEDGDMPLFNSLRDWRNEQGKKEGLPPYIMFTNRQLATIAKQRPQSSAKLAEIEGIGKAKVEKYGKEILTIVASPQKEKAGEDGLITKEEKADADK